MQVFEKLQACKLKLEDFTKGQGKKQFQVSTESKIQNGLTGKIFEIQKKVKQNIHVVKHKLLYIRVYMVLVKFQVCYLYYIIVLQNYY